MTLLLDPPSDCISRVRFAPERGSSLLLASSWDAHVRLYDASAGKQLAAHSLGLPVLDCAFQDANSVLAGGLGKELFAIDLAAQREFRLGGHDAPIKCVEFHAPTQQALTASWDRTLRAWDPRQPAAPAAVVQLGTKAFAMDVGANSIVVGGADRCVYVYDTRRLGELVERRESILRHEIRALKVGLDSASFASSSVEGRVAVEYLDAAENAQARYAFKCHRAREEGGQEAVHPVNALAFHPVHGTFATGGGDGGVCVWDPGAKKRLWKLDPFDTSVSSLCFSADGSRLAIGASRVLDEDGKTSAQAVQLAVRETAGMQLAPKGRK